MSETTFFELPTSYQFGYVVGRLIYAIADTSEDVDELPQARAARGRVIFTPRSKGAKVTVVDYPAIVMNTPSIASLSAAGRILDAEGRQGIWLIQGVYTVTFDLEATDDGYRGELAPFDIEVLPEHTAEAPLNLATAIPASIPEGVYLATLAVPNGTGVLSRNETTLEFEWIPLSDVGGGGGPITADQVTDSGAVGRDVMRADTQGDARAAIGAQVAGSYATAAQGAKADSAVQPALLASAIAGVTVGSIGAATAAQGAKADTAVQPASLAAAIAGVTVGSIGAATSAQGAKADTAIQPAGMTKAAVGLGNVDNTSDVNKPVSTAQSAAIAAAVAALQTGAPADMNTFVELAAALADDPAFADTMAAALAARLRVDTAGQSLTVTEKTNALTNLGGTTLGQALFQIASESAARAALDAQQTIKEFTSLPDATALGAAFPTASPTNPAYFVVNA